VSHTVEGVTPARDDAPFSLADAEIDRFVSKASRAGSESVAALSALQRAADAYPQLSADAQLELHARYRAGVAAKAQLDAGTLRGGKKVQALRAVRAGDEAFAYLVASNLRLVRLICREQAEQRYGRERASTVLPDLVAEANVALAEAVTSFDPTRMPKFVTWAGAQVRSRVRARLSEEDTPIEVPSSWRRLKRIAAVRIPKLTEALGRPPTTEELQADLTAYCIRWAESKLTPEQQTLPAEDRYRLAVAKMRKQGTERGIREIETVLLLTRGAASLDAPATEDGTRTVGDGLASPGGDERLIDDLDMGQLRQVLGAALAQLTDREREIVMLRYGLGDEHGRMMTFNEICTRFGVTAERVRQIEAKVLAKLRGSDTAMRDQLAAFLPGLDGTDLDVRANQLTKPRRR
jgi:RNA polymerase primary sigma factor